MKYGSVEYQYALPIARGLVENAAFRCWVLSKSRFAKVSDADLLSQRNAVPPTKPNSRVVAVLLYGGVPLSGMQWEGDGHLCGI